MLPLGMGYRGSTLHQSNKPSVRSNRINFKGLKFPWRVDLSARRLNGLQVKWKDTEPSFVFNGRFDDLRRNALGRSGESVNQGGIAQYIDCSRDSATGIGYDLT